MMDKFLLQAMEALLNMAAWQVFLLVSSVVGLVLALRMLLVESYVSWNCRHIPCPAGRIPFLGHALKLLK